MGREANTDGGGPSEGARLPSVAEASAEVPLSAGRGLSRDAAARKPQVPEILTLSQNKRPRSFTSDVAVEPLHPSKQQSDSHGMPHSGSLGSPYGSSHPFLSGGALRDSASLGGG